MLNWKLISKSEINDFLSKYKYFDETIHKSGDTSLKPILYLGTGAGPAPDN